MSDAPHMVKQTITFSDGSETVISYRGVIVDGVLTPDSDALEFAAPVEPVAEEKPKGIIEKLLG